ncbi:uncharacterized protein IWZ02DRAFT_436909 [Phyllosticta citriasiana]|uniref:uncharacterized protein n=1 Tax=Phyllosticta citriasiana TaxID=595635 RepID=UPI0030FD7332
MPFPTATTLDLNAPDDDDPFIHPQNLESIYYNEGFSLGRTDGTRAGRIEGRVFGLEKGFDKFFAMGRLGGRAGVWGARLVDDDDDDARRNRRERREGEDKNEGKGVRLPALPPHPRLRTQIHALHALAEAASLETRNTEDGVADFDDRYRRARAKVKVVEGLVGERGGGEEETREGEGEEREARHGREGAGEAEAEALELELEVEVTMGDVEVGLEQEREREKRDMDNDKQEKPAAANSGNSAAAAKAKKPPRAPKRAGVKVAGGAQRGGEKNMEDFGIGDARALGRLV